MFERHPNPELNALFERTPYQGVAPSKSNSLFIGLDANYDPSIAESPIFARVLDYHADAVGFWRRHGVHHPFLLPEYRGDGRLYHRSFARIGLNPGHAAGISFAELLHVPTVGRSRLSPEDLNQEHLRALNEAILSGSPKNVFVSASVVRLMEASGAFDWIPKAPVGEHDGLSVLRQRGGRRVFVHLHLSVYGKFHARKVAEAAAIRRLVDAAAT
jgi:hypothetical protein